jgi:hypothetical protein
MGFWVGTFRAFKAMNQAFGKAADLLDEVSDNLERRSRSLEIQNEINKFELDRSRLGESWFSDNEFDRKILNKLYEKLCSDYSDSVDDKYFKQKDKLQEDYVDYKVKVLLTTIKQDNVSIREAVSSLAITKINLRKRLIKNLTKLINIASPIKHEKYIVRAKLRRDELHNEIVELEPQRKTVITSTSLSIAPKVQYEFFDEYKNGFYKDWFENGRQRWLIHFDDDELTIAQRFKDDGRLYIEVTPEKYSEHYKIYHKDGKVTLKALKEKKGITLFVKQHDKTLLSILFKVNKCPSKMLLSLKSIMSLNGFLLTFIPSKRPINYYEIQQVIKDLSSVSNELRNIRKLSFSEGLN